MTRVIKTGLCGLLIVVSAAALAQVGSDSFFSDFNGEPQRVENYTGDGNWRVVMIWASDCHICNAEAEDYAQFHESQRNNRVGVLGISMDGEEKKEDALAFMKRHDLPYPNLIGEPGMVSLYYAALTQEPLRGTPTFLVFDPSGELAAAQAGAVSPEAITRFIARKDAAQSANR